MRKTILLFLVLAFLSVIGQAQTVTDIDGNVYNTVTIGTQIWMKENLKVTHYRNGDSIPNVTNISQWGLLDTGAYCNYNNDSNNVSIYGRLYNWKTVDDSRHSCPVGWHVPSNSEWNILEKYLDITVDTTIGGMIGTDIGGKLKETGTTHWLSPNTGATNSSGFSALPGGDRSANGFYNGIEYDGRWWSATTSVYIDNAWTRILYNNDSRMSRNGNSKAEGYSIRCICDSTTQINEIKYYKSIKIYPIPAIDKVYIDCAERQDLKMQIYNVVGECVLQRELTTSTNEINVSLLSKGIYIIKLTSADWTVQRKLIKE